MNCVTTTFPFLSLFLFVYITMLINLAKRALREISMRIQRLFLLAIVSRVSIKKTARMMITQNDLRNSLTVK